MDFLPKNDARFESILYGSDVIARRIQEMATEISRDFPSDAPLLLVGILKGVAPFQIDLARALTVAGMTKLQLGFLRASTYGSGMKANGEKDRHVEISWVGMPEKAQNILILDDVLDQGFTLAAVKTAVQQRYADADVRTAVMLIKNVKNATADVMAKRTQFKPDYTGLEAPDRWIVGYGLDIAEEFRALPYVAIVHEECFK